MTAYPPRIDALIVQLQRELGLAIECGQLVLNLNQGTLASHDVHSHHRGSPIVQKESDRPRRTA